MNASLATDRDVRIRSRFDRLIVAVFVVGIALPTAGVLFGWSPEFDMKLENRRPAAIPSVECRYFGPIPWPRKRSLVVFPAQFEAWFNDHFGFRSALIGAYAHARMAGLTTAKLDRPADKNREGDGALVGTDGWLYILNPGGSRHEAGPLTAAELDAWINSLRQRHAWLAKQNCRHLFFLAPDKATIYPEFLPQAQRRRGPVTRFDQLAGLLGDGRTTNFVDLRADLLVAKQHHAPYYQTDSHWNDYGAWIGYQRIIAELQPIFPALKPQRWDDYELTVTKERGDLHRILPTYGFVENCGLLLHRRTPSAVTISVEQAAVADGVYTEVTRTKNPAAECGKLVVIHDSFMDALRPFLSQHWREVVYVHERNGFPAELIRRERPELVMTELVERYLQISIAPLPPAESSPVESTPAVYEAAAPQRVQTR